jgi:dTDP-4-dehydrorhamnose 3,5-epimerase
MIFTPLEIIGAFLVELKPITDERGFFARAYCQKEFADQGIHEPMVQANVSHNKLRGMLRGLHWQTEPHAEAKFVRCIQGAIFDVMVDVRPDSATYKQWYGVELTDSNNKALYIPPGCAHGYQVLDDNTNVLYQVSAFYAPESERGARWDDPSFNIDWPIKDNVLLSEKDKQWAAFNA